MAELQSQVRTLAIELAEKVVGANLDRDANLRPGRPVHRRAQRQPDSRPGAGRLMSDRDRRLRGGPVRDRQGRGLARDASRTSCSRWPARSRPTTSCARPSPTRPSRSSGGRRWSRTSSAAGRRRSPPRWCRFVVGAGRARRPARDHRQAGRPGRRGAPRGGRRGPHRLSRSTTTSAPAAGRRPRPGHRQARHGQGDHRPVRARRRRRPGRRHRHRRHRPPPSRAAPRIPSLYRPL